MYVTPMASEPSFAPTTDDEEDEHGESDDPTSDHSLPGSTATTRSRSRRRRTRDQETEPSSDRSYQGGLDLIQRGSSMNPRAGPASRLFRCLPHGLMGQQGLPVDKLFQSIDPLALQWWPRLELLLAGNASAFASCAATLSLDTGHSLDTLGVVPSGSNSLLSLVPVPLCRNADLTLCGALLNILEGSGAIMLPVPVCMRACRSSRTSPPMRTRRNGCEGLPLLSVLRDMIWKG